MENRIKFLGINKKTVVFFHRIMIIAMLHSTFIAPSQSLIESAYGYKSINYDNFKSKNTRVLNENVRNSNIATNQNFPSIVYNKISNRIPVKKELKDYKINSDIKEGLIGVSNTNPLDDVKDNLFKFDIKELPNQNIKTYLTYELFGVQDNNAVSRSINDRFSVGGYVIKNQLGWSTQREEININWLKVGENKIMFSIPKGANYQYQIKNVTIEFDINNENTVLPALVLNNSNLNYIKDDKLYIKGFLRNYATDVKVLVDETALNFIDGEYEGFLTLDKTIKERKFVLVKAFDKSGVLGQELILLDNLLEADLLYIPEEISNSTIAFVKAGKEYILKSNGASIQFKDSSLLEDKEIKISKLRKVDIAPMSSGLVNVTQGGYGFRFMPDGTTFNKPVTLEIGYDENLIPKGHNANEIKTFYFNTQSKAWTAIERDTINKIDKTIVSSTNHFTDYINGIIQTPESPETAGFTPTMMNDVKAVDPSSEMTLISPPEVSQKGDANVSYPIKIPAGRKGMQPQIAIQYSNEGGNGWLGQGWNINTPSVSIDTKWGVPTFNATNESEIYTINGEQLMYPKFNNLDWMPNRHQLSGTASSPIYDTPDVARTGSLKLFTPRKQGSFAKIERLGNNPTNYYWKVTNTDGSINWYGGKNTVTENSVIRDSNANIVHWGLLLTQDVFGNCVKYEYENYLMPSQSGQNANLNEGVLFHIKNISYTGFNEADYKYEVIFNSSTRIRSDISINARLGVKQIEPYFLDNIIVKKIGVTDQIRKYKLFFNSGKFGKAQLTAVSEVDKDNTVFYTHTFEYYDDLKVEGQDENVYFDNGITQSVCNDTPVPCTDSDNDGVCNENDPCPNVAGPISNNGCPKQRCYILSFLDRSPIFNYIPQGVNVYINNNLLIGSPFYTFSTIINAIQVQHPVANYYIPDSEYNYSRLVIVSSQTEYSNLKMFSLNGNQIFNQNFNSCEQSQGKIINKTNYSSYFSNLAQNNTFVLSNGISLNSECPPTLTNTEFLIPGYIPSFDSAASLLGSSKSEAISAGFYLGMGVGKNRFTKMTTLGVQWNWGNDKSIALTALIDINGDGLEDIVSKEGNLLFYKKHIVIRTYNTNNEPITTHAFENKKPITGIDNFYRAFGRNRSSNFQITFGLKKIGGFIGWDKSKSNAETDMYFTDGNGDGLMDIVRDGVVYFNRLDVNGNPNFMPDSKGTENLVITAAPKTIDAPAESTQEEITLPAFDVVKVWEAPADGTIKIDNTIQLSDSTKEALVTVEMKNTLPLNCYSVSFPVPSYNLYRYNNSYNFLLIGSNNQNICWTDQNLNYSINESTYNTPNLFRANGNNGGISFVCPTNTYLYNNNFFIINGNYSTNPYYGIQNNNFLNENSVILNNIFSGYPTTTLISQINQDSMYLKYRSGYGIESNNQIRMSYFGGFNIVYYSTLSNLILNATNKVERNSIGSSSIVFTSNGNSPTLQNVGVYNNISVNGNVINNNLNLTSNVDYTIFKNTFESNFPDSLVTINNSIVTITVLNTSQSFNSISLTAVDNSIINTYNFIPVTCNAPLTNNQNNFIDSKQEDWSFYTPTKKELEIANYQYLSIGEEKITSNDYKFNIYLDLDSEHYVLIDNNEKKYYNIKDGKQLIDVNIINFLNLKYTLYIDKEYYEIIEKYKNIDHERFINAKKDAQKWLEDYYKKQEEQNASSASRTINQTTCNETPNELCLLYGTQLNASNVNVTNTLTTNCTGQPLTVKKGDRIYFRVHSVDNGNPPVNWNPKVEYLNNSLATITDANGHKPFSSSYSDSFVLSGKNPVAFPGNSGTAKITWTPFTITPTDKVTYQIIKETVAAAESEDDELPTILSSDIIFTQTCNPNVSSTINPTTFPIDLNNIIINTPAQVDNLSQTYFYFKVIATSNVDWKNSQWKPKMECITTTPISPSQGSTPEGSLTATNTLYPVADYDLYKYYPCGNAFAKKDISTINNGVGLSIQPQLTGVFSPGDNGKINFVVKRGTLFIGRRIFTITNGVVSVDVATAIPLGSTGGNTIEIMYTSDDSENDSNAISLLSKLALTGNTLAKITYGTSSGVNITKQELNLYQKTDLKFGSFFREWGQFMYRPATVTGALPTGIANANLIKEEALQFTMNQAQVDQLNNSLDGVNDTMTQGQLETFQNNQNNQNLLNSLAFISANATRETIDSVITDRWIGFHKENYASELSYKAEKLTQSIINLENGYSNIEQGVIKTGAYAISKFSEGYSNNNFSAGLNGYGYGVNGSISNNGQNTTVTDYVDYNGDRYPDIVTTEMKQYTNKTGGLYIPFDSSTGTISISSSDSFGFGASGSFKQSNKDKGSNNSETTTLTKKTNGETSKAGAGISGEFSHGSSTTQRVWTDINGDGLSDLIETSNNNTNVQLNLGTNVISTNNNWGNLPLFVSKSNSISGGLGVNKWQGSTEAGLSLTATFGNTENTLIDINGDGLLDIVYRTGDNILNNNLGYKLNLGNRFIDKGMWMPFNNLNFESTTISASINFGFTYAQVWKIFGVPIKFPAVNINGTPLSTSTNKTKKSMTDFDGDGYVDLVEEISPNNVKVYHSRIRRTDMLKSVTNPLGGKFTIDYKVQPVDYDNPNAKWAMSDVLIEDNYNKVNDGVDVYKKHFVYEKGRYDRREREFYGYETVKTEDYTLDTSGNSVLYRTSISNYLNQSYFLNGLLDNSYVIKGGDVTKKYSKTINYYKIYKLTTNNDFINLNTPVLANYDVGGSEGRATVAVLLTKTVNELYELAPSPQLTTQVNLTYDTKGRVIEYHNKGNINDNTDDYISNINYHSSLDPLNIINIPESISVSTASGVELRKRKTEVDSSNGTITTIYANNSGIWLETTMEYDVYGNLVRIVYPENTANQRMFYKYTYDSIYNKYVTSISDAFGYTSSATYNSNFDKVIETVDLSGNKMRYDYDTFGRNTLIIAPKEIALGIRYTLKFEYYPYFYLLPSDCGVTFNATDPNASTFVPVAVTSHYDQQHPENDIETYTFIDGMARPIQVKKDVWLNKNEDPQNAVFFEGLTISGKTSYDEFGRAIEQFHPLWEEKSFTSKFLLNESDSQFSSTTEYDELDRPVKSIDPEGNISTIGYNISPDVDGTMAIKTKSNVDQNGAQNIITETYKDVNGRVISTNNVGGNSGSIWTKFTYNEIGELLTYKDAEDLVTSYTYDMLGRKLSVNHPDNGLTTFTYDNVNMTSLQTANLQNQGTTINYIYDINRLTNINYPNTPDGNANIANVTYKYGSASLTGVNINKRGKLIYQSDATGTQSFQYGSMGEMTINTRTVVGPNIPTRIFRTSYNYDSWNRLQNMIYPDGEKITYKYDLGGNLNQMTGVYNNSPYDYISRIDYDHFEQRTYLLYGNKTETFYNYSASLRRLNNLNVKTSDHHDLFNNKYNYDKVGNVTSLSSSAGTTANNMAGKYGHTFEYDNLNRLVKASGSFDGDMSQIASGNDANSDYNLDMKYSDTHSILLKNQRHNKNGNSFAPNTYKNAYIYPTDSHKVEKITDGITGETENFSYDLNGNIITRITNNESTSKNLTWDESNRLRVVSDNQSMQHYVYDASGERILKANSDIETVFENGTLLNEPGSVSINGYTSYPSGFIVITADGVYSKHYYAGSQRIVSRLGDNTADIFNAEIYLQSPEEPDLPRLDDKKLQQTQKADLQRHADKLNKGTIKYKDYKPVPLATQEKALQEENEIILENPYGSNSSPLERLGEEQAPQVVPIYYYHPDHLGTSTALTDYNGNAYQFFLNLPFGETMAQQLGSNYYNSPYKFNGKELDEETGFYYYGARYYDPRISIWQSVDPLAETMPFASPYNYCLQNPINLVDPDGKAPDWHRNGSGVLVADFGDNAQSLADYTGMSLQEARAEFNHNYYHYEDTMFGGEQFYQSDHYISSGDYGPSYGVEKDLKYSLMLVGAIAAPILGAEAAIIGAFSEVTWGSAAYGIFSNTLSQGIANGGDLSKVNVIEAGASALPGIGPIIIGETFNFNFAEASKGIQTPISFEHAIMQIGGGLLSNIFGNTVDSKNVGKGVGKVYGEVAKFAVETGTNVAPKLIDETQNGN